MGWLKGIEKSVKDFVSHPVQNILNSGTAVLNRTGDLLEATDLPGTHRLNDTLHGIGLLSPGHMVLQAKPMESFAQGVNDINQNFGTYAPYAQMGETAALSYFGTPAAGAAFNMAMQAGDQQLQNEQTGQKFDWGKFGNQAAVDVGTAALAYGMNALSTPSSGSPGANGAPSMGSGYSNAAANTGASTGSGAMSTGFNAAQGIGSTGSAAASDAATFGSAASDAAALGQGASSLSAAAPAAVSGTGSMAPTMASSPYAPAEMNLGRDLTANISGNSPVWNAAVTAAKGAGQNLGTQALSAAFPTDTQAVSGDGMAGVGAPLPNVINSDAFQAFGPTSLNAPTGAGKHISSDDYGLGLQAIQANAAQQQNNLMDQFRMTGQVPGESSAYDNYANSIGQSYNKSITDYTNSSNLYNQWQDVIAANPTVDPSVLQSDLAVTGALGNADLAAKLTPEQQQIYQYAQQNPDFAANMQGVFKPFVGQPLLAF